MNLVKRVLEFENTIEKRSNFSISGRIHKYWPTVSTKEKNKSDVSYYSSTNFQNDRFWPNTRTKSQYEEETRVFYKDAM
ncbi:MAG: hypothetical protein VX028_02335 [Nanoarchaeota archaeon]|nr:hypothetical protein [Nanoarchaeota archaeon]